jgi:YfiH family protein
VVGAGDAGRGSRSSQDTVAGCDGLITGTAGPVLCVTAADCLPVFVHDPGRGAAAVLHAGWRGLVAGVLDAGVATLVAEFGSDASQLRAGIGPGACGRCYEVGDEVVAAVRSLGPTESIRPSGGGRALLDLAVLASEQLERAGLGRERIHRSPQCTIEDRRLFSHRRSLAEGSPDGRMLAVVWLTGRGDV